MALENTRIDYSTPEQVANSVEKTLLDQLEVLSMPHRNLWGQDVAESDVFLLPGTGISIKTATSTADLVEKLILELINRAYMYEEVRY